MHVKLNKSDFFGNVEIKNSENCSHSSHPQCTSHIHTCFLHYVEAHILFMLTFAPHICFRSEGREEPLARGCGGDRVAAPRGKRGLRCGQSVQRVLGQVSQAGYLASVVSLALRHTPFEARVSGLFSAATCFSLHVELFASP